MNLPRAPTRVGPVLGCDHVESHRGQGEGVQRARVLVPFDDEHKRPRWRIAGTTAVHTFDTPSKNGGMKVSLMHPEAVLGWTRPRRASVRFLRTDARK